MSLSENMGMVVKMWLTEDCSGCKKRKDELKVISKMATANAPELAPLPGIAFKTRDEQQGLKFEMRTVGLKEGTLDEVKSAISASYGAPGE